MKFCHFCGGQASLVLPDGVAACLRHAVLDLTEYGSLAYDAEFLQQRVVLLTDALLRAAEMLGPTFGCDEGCLGCTVEGQSALDLITDTLGVTPIKHG